MKSLFDKKLTGYILLCTSGFFTVIVYATNQYAIEQTDPIIFACYVLLTGALILLPYYTFKYSLNYHKKILNTYAKSICLVSFFALLGSIFWFLAIKLVGGTMSSLYDNVTIIFSFILGLIFLQEKLN